MASTPFVVIFFTGWSQILLYGCNIVLYGTSIFLLHQRRGLNRTTAFQFISATILFALATMLAVVTTALIVGQLLQISNLTQLAMQSSNATASSDNPQTLPPSGTSLTGGIDLRACKSDIFFLLCVLILSRRKSCSIITYVGLQLIDFTAFFILVHRCYMIYNRSWKILVAPLIIILADIGVYSAALPVFTKLSFGNIESVPSTDNRKMMMFSTAVIVLNTIANSMLTLLIAGKIWSIRRRMHQLVGRGAPSIHRKYDTLVSMTLESGLIIPMALVAINVCIHTGNTVGSGLLAACVPQIIAFAPLLIMVRAGLGLTVEANHVTLQTGTEIELQRSVSRPLHVSVTVSQTKSVASSGKKGIDTIDEPDSDVGRNAEPREGYAL
ncbi:hypothetical protein WG66_004443 [Moniliophthora roreri]|nr:hypothetical protein WG66_004443 [Moniliophthora roreri]